MASDRPIFLRPVEIVDPLNAGGFHFRYRFDAGAWHNITIPSGTYASILTVLYAIEYQIEAVIPSPNNPTIRPRVMTASHDFFIRVYKVGAGSQDVEFDAGVIPETALRKMLGFDSDTPSALGVVLDGDTNLGNSWYPYRNPSDREGFQSDQAEAFRGIKTAQGLLAGIGMPVVFAERDLEFPMEPVVNVLEEFCTNEYEVARCAETFFKECRTAQINISTHKNPRGFWFVKDVTYLQNLAVRVMRGVTEGIHFLYSTPDRWCYGTPPTRGPDYFKVAVSRGQAFYDVNFKMQTADTPLFTASDAIA